MGSHYEAPIRRPLVAGEKSYHDVTVDIAKPIETKANKQWWIVFTTVSYTHLRAHET